MSEFDPTSLPQPTDIKRPMVADIFNSASVFSGAGFPLFARDPSDYDAVGGLRLEPYQRGDSPSRDESEFPYNATWFDHLRENYADSLRLLETMRQAYARECTQTGQIDKDGVVDLYHMGVQLPMFIMWRGKDPVKNGEIPPAITVLRQALLGIGTVLLHLPQDEQEDDLTGERVAAIAEDRGDLIGDEMSLSPNVPRMVCPASPEMITGLARALIEGNEKRGHSNLLEKHNIDIDKLRRFASFIGLHSKAEENMLEAIEKLYLEEPVINTGRLLRLKTKVEKYDDIVARYGAFLNEHQPALYEALDRTDTPPRANPRRIYKLRTELLMGRVKVLQFDDPSNITPEVVADFDSLMPKK